MNASAVQQSRGLFQGFDYDGDRRRRSGGTCKLSVESKQRGWTAETAWAAVYRYLDGVALNHDPAYHQSFTSTDRETSVAFTRCIAGR